MEYTFFKLINPYQFLMSISARGQFSVLKVAWSSLVLLLISLFAQAALERVPVALAAASITVSDFKLPNGQFPGAGIKASSGAMAIASFYVMPSGAGTTLNAATAVFSGTGFTESDLASIANATTSGVMLYVDNGITPSVFDASDQRISLTSPAWSGVTSSTITLTPTTPVSLSNGTTTIFYVVIRTSGTVSNGDTVYSIIGVNSVVTSDGSGPTAGFTSAAYTADTTAPSIISVQGFQASPTTTVTFSEPVQKPGGGALAYADGPFLYTDGGGSPQTITGISHAAGQAVVTVTMSAGLDAQDLSVPATINAVSGKVSDFAGNTAGVTAIPFASPLSITTNVIPATTTGAVTSANNPLVTFVAVGGAGSYTWTSGAASTNGTLSALGLTLVTSTGRITGTVANAPGSFQVLIKVIDGVSASTTKTLTISISPAGGGGVPGISNVNPGGAMQNTTSLSVTITGTNTHFTSTSTVQFLMPPGAAGINGITVGALTSSTALTLTFPVAIASTAATGARDVSVAANGQTVNLPGGFFVVEAAGAGLNLSLPADNSTGMVLTPVFTFTQSANLSALSYRVTVKTSADPANTTQPIWDYALPVTAGSGTHCTSSACNVTYGAGLYNIIVQPTSLAPNTDYYWQVKSYATSSVYVNSSVTPLETTAVRKFTTTNSVSDSSPPSVFHRALFSAPESANLNVYARVMDNIATAVTTPALTTTLKYCSGAGCFPGTSAAGLPVGNGYFRYVIPSATIGAAGTVTRYFIEASDGTNNVEFKNSGQPFQITSATAGASSLTGSIKDSSGVCPAGVVGATLFLGGVGFSTSTTADCTFVLPNVFSGTFEVVAFRDGYGEKAMQGIPSNMTGLNITLAQGQFGGFGGDVTKPHVKFTGPMDGSQMLPGNDTNFKVFVTFDKAMSQNSISTAGNMKIQEVNPSTGALNDITYKGAWTYYPTAPSIMGIPPEPNVAVWAFTGGNVFGDNKTIAAVVTSNVTDMNGNPIQGNQTNGDFAFSWTTGASFTGSFGSGEQFGMGQFMPPHVNGSTPAPGAFSVPKNQKMTLTFSDPMASDGGTYALLNYIKLFRVSGSTETDISASAIGSLSLDGTKQVLTITTAAGFNGGVLESDTTYRLKVLGGAKGANNLTLGPPTSPNSVMYFADFKTSSVSDTGAPAVSGSYPSANDTGVPVNLGAINIGFDKDLDASSVTTESVSLSIGSTAVNGTVEYRPLERQIMFVPLTALNPSTLYTLNLTTAIKGLNGTALAASVSRSFTSGAADATVPAISYMNSDEYSMALTFSEPMNFAKALDTLNWSASVLNAGAYATLKYGAAGFNPASAGTAVSLTSATFSYDSVTRTLKIQGLNMPQAAIGSELYLAMQTAGGTVAKDLSGNAITASGNVARAPIKSSQTTMGELGPMSMTGSAFQGAGFVPTNFSSSTFGFAPPVEVRPFNTMVSQTTTYAVRLPISTQIPSGGTVVLTFPTGFDVSGAKQDVNSPMRTDLNGPGSGAPTFKCATPVTGGKSCSNSANSDDTSTAQGGLADDGVVVDTAARSVTVYLSAATNSEGHDFLTIDVAGIKNSSIPKDFNTSGYTVDVKTKNSATVLESLTSMPFFLQNAGTASFTGRITATGNSATGTMSVYLMSPLTGPLTATSDDFNTSASATYSFTNIPTGQYMFMTDQSVTIGATDYQGLTTPVPVSVTSSSAYNFTIQSLTAVGTTVTLNVNGPALEPIDVFAGSAGGFKAKSVTLDSDALNPQAITLKLPDGTWFVGVGPQMPKGPMSGPPPTPNYVIPRPLDVTISGTVCKINGTVGCSASISLTAASKSILGRVKDGNNKPIVKAEVYAYSPQGGVGTRAQTDSTGAFTLGVTDGSYIIGAYVFGMPASREIPVTVTSDATTYLLIDGATTAVTPVSASTTLVLKVAKPDYTLTGKVTDGTNGVQGAGVYARRTDASGNASANTDSSGNYTLYVGNGTWAVGAFLPQYGQLSEQTVVVSGANQSSINFSPSQTGTYYPVSGRVYRDTNGNSSWDSGEEIQGAFVRITGNSRNNEAITGADGSYSFYVPAANGYTLRGFAPSSSSELAPLTGINITATTTGKDLVLSNPQTVSVTLSSSVSQAFMDAFSPTGMGAHAEIKSGTSTSMALPNGSYRFTVQVPGVTLTESSSSGTAGTSYNQTTGILTVNGSAAGIAVTIPTLRSVTGTVTNGSTAIAEAWVEIVQSSSGINLGTKTASDGTFTLNLADSAASYTINAMAPGYVREPSSLTVNGANVGNQTLAMTAATLAISGTVYIGSTGAPNAFVRGEKQGGGFSGTQADASGNYTLYVTAGTWRVLAVAEGYAEAGYASNPIVIGTASTTGKNITLSSSVSLSTPLSKPVTPASGGTVENSSGGLKITIPPSAMGSGQGAGNVAARETNKVRRTSTARPVNDKAQEITATDSSNSPVTKLDGSITVEQTYTVATLNSTASAADSSINTKTEVDQLKMAYWDETNSNWVTLPTTIVYKDSAGNIVTTSTASLSNVASVTISAPTTHLSQYAPIVSTGSNPPATPTGLTATVMSSTSVKLDWTGVNAATSYDIYRSTASGGTFSRLGSEPTVSASTTVTYTDTGLTADTNYWYKISALSTGGESTSTSALLATTPAATAASTATVTSGGGGGGGGALTTLTTVTTPAATTTTTTVTPTPSVAPASAFGFETPSAAAPAAAGTPSTTQAPSAPAPAPTIVSTISDAFKFSGYPTVSVAPGQVITFTYAYTNQTSLAQTVKVRREFMNAIGKALETGEISVSLAPQQAFTRKVTLPLNPNLAAGVYKQVITITDAKSGKQLAQGSLSFTVIKPPAATVPAMAIKFSGVPKSVKLGKILTFKYQFTNSAKAPVKVTIKREFKDANGKLLSSSKTIVTLKAKQTFARWIRETPAKTAAAGASQMIVKILDASGKAIATGTATVELKK